MFIVQHVSPNLHKLRRKDCVHCKLYIVQAPCPDGYSVRLSGNPRPGRRKFLYGFIDLIYFQMYFKNGSEENKHFIFILVESPSLV